MVGDDIFLGLSSNLSLKNIPNLKQVLFSGVDELLVSVSGFSQKVHEIYHKGSDINVVKKHLEYIASFMNEMSTRVAIKYLDFGYNKEEIPLFNQYASKHGFHFTSIQGFGSPLEPEQPTILKYHDNRMKEDLYRKWTVKKYMDGISKFCNSQFYLDCNADVYLCCRFPNLEKFRIGNFLENSFKELLTRRQLHTFCTRCNVKMD
jgi:sulfatase maturation enzyme AslB (radical SAM superfamily)